MFFERSTQRIFVDGSSSVSSKRRLVVMPASFTLLTNTVPTPTGPSVALLISSTRGLNFGSFVPAARNANTSSIGRSIVAVALNSCGTVNLLRLKSGLEPARRGRDSNPRTRFPPLRDFQSRPFNRSGTSPGVTLLRRQGYAKRYAARRVLVLATSQAFQKTFGLICTFGGIGVIVNGLIV